MTFWNIFNIWSQEWMNSKHELATPICNARPADCVGLWCWSCDSHMPHTAAHFGLHLLWSLRDHFSNNSTKCVKIPLSHRAEGGLSKQGSNTRRLLLDIPSKGFKDNLLKPQIPLFALGTESKSLISGRQNNLVSRAARADSYSRLLTRVVGFQYQFEISVMECMQHVDDSLSPRLDRHKKGKHGCRVLLPVLCSTPHILQAYCTKCGSSLLST